MLGKWNSSRCVHVSGVRAPSSQVGTPGHVTTQRHAEKHYNHLRVAVDVDEVLGLFLPTLCKYCSEEHQLKHSVDEFWVYEYAKIWKCDQERSTFLVHEFFKSPYFLEGIPVVPGAVEVLQELKSRPEIDLVVVTSRQHAIQDITCQWIHSNFDGVFSDVQFGNHWAKSGSSRSKSQMCIDAGATILIDDNPSYAYECAMKGIEVLLFNWENNGYGGYPWSAQPPEMKHENITVVRSWEAVKQYCEDALLNTK